MRRSHDETGTRGEGHPIFSALYGPLGFCIERLWMGERRARLLKGARGAVLEIGGGAGANLPHYRDVDRVTVAEPDPYMRKRLVRKLGATGSTARLQDRIEPFWRRLFGGCHPNRDTVAAIEDAWFEIESFESFYPPVPLSGLIPHVQGSATVKLAA